ncbi:hypothetical protein [Aeromicrobium endophyticum]|uniref:hypothetical protein n=1 Tax=Aeromicrobium endophyticum TaxID=2292704 RepID=UPI0013146616|nr:hypothetical protein [Aeromicrobium endophyticum]
MKLIHLCAALAATALLTACSSGSDAARVADVPDPAASSQAQATDRPATSDGPSDDSGPTKGRPQFRLDDTDQRRTAIQSAYSQCLIDHGAPEIKPGDGGRGGDSGSVAAAAGEGADGKPVGPFVGDPVPASASAACLSKLPVMPVELESGSNPRFHDQSLAYVACLADGGLHVTLLNDDNLDWTYQEGRSVPDDTSQLEKSCLLSSFQR